MYWYAFNVRLLGDKAYMRDVVFTSEPTAVAHLLRQIFMKIALLWTVKNWTGCQLLFGTGFTYSVSIYLIFRLRQFSKMAQFVQVVYNAAKSSVRKQGAIVCKKSGQK